MTAGVMSMALSGCVSSGLIADNSYTRTKIGAGVGAVAGGLLAYKTSKNKKVSSSKRNRNTILGVLGGAAVGGGDIVFILLGTQTINNEDTITYKSQDFRVQTINPIDVEGETIVYLVPASLKQV